MLIKIHAMLESILIRLEKLTGGISDDSYKKLQVVLFLINAAGLGFIFLGVLFNSSSLIGLGVIGYIVPSIWDRLQMFLITTKVGE